MAILVAIESDLAEAKYVERNLQTRENWIMATATSPTTSNYVQQAFNWDGLESEPVVAKTKTANSAAPIGSSPSQRGGPSLTVPSYITSTSARRGRCEHIGGMLASVLERYGIGLDQLIAEIDGMK